MRESIFTWLDYSAKLLCEKVGMRSSLFNNVDASTQPYLIRFIRSVSPHHKRGRGLGLGH